MLNKKYLILIVTQESVGSEGFVSPQTFITFSDAEKFLKEKTIRKDGASKDWVPSKYKISTLAINYSDLR